MKRHVNNGTLFLAFAALTGCIIGAFIWGYLKFANVGITIIWDWIPDLLTTKYYTVGMCLVGGLVIGLFHKKYGKYPDTMAEAVNRVKNNAFYPYEHLWLIVIGAYLSILFGGAVGPECGLVCILLALCFWAIDQFGMAAERMRNIIAKNPDVPRGKVFRVMLSGLKSKPKDIVYDKSYQWKKSEQISSGVVCGICALIIYLTLNQIFGECISIPQLTSSEISGIDNLILITLIVTGIAAGYLYVIFRKITSKFFGFLRSKGLIVLNALIGGAILGIVGTFFPMAMFSGGSQMQALMYEYMGMTPVLLLLNGVIKLFLTNVCIESGWRGGHFFPLIFSGVSIGYAMSMFLGTNQVLCVIVVSASMLATVLQEPFSALILSLVFFPVEHVGWMAAAAFAGGCIPLPKGLRQNPDDKGFLYNVTHFVMQKRLPDKEGKDG